VPELSYNEIADRQLDQLEHDALRLELRAHVNQVLDALESNPGDERLRRKEFRQLPDWGFCYAVELRGDGEDWVVLWSWNPAQEGEPVVIYVGVPPGG
jgi:hypothetical protein